MASEQREGRGRTDGRMDGWRRDGEGGTMLIIHPAQPHRRYPKQRSRPRVWPLVEGQEWGAHHRPINAKPGPQKAGPGLLIKESQTCASWSNFPNREGGCPGCPMARSRATFDRIPYVETVSLNFEGAAALRIPVGQAGPRVRWWKGRVFWPAGSTGREFKSSGWAGPGGPGLPGCVVAAGTGDPGFGGARLRGTGRIITNQRTLPSYKADPLIGCLLFLWIGDCGWN